MNVEADNKKSRNLPQIAVSRSTKKIQLWEGDTKRKSEGAAAALGVGGRVKQEASGLTLIYFRTPVSGLASAGRAANYVAEGRAAGQLAAGVLATRGTAVHAVVMALKGWLTCWAGRECIGVVARPRAGGEGGDRRFSTAREHACEVVEWMVVGWGDGIMRCCCAPLRRERWRRRCLGRPFLARLGRRPLLLSACLPSLFRAWACARAFLPCCPLLLLLRAPAALASRTCPRPAHCLPALPAHSLLPLPRRIRRFGPRPPLALANLEQPALTSLASHHAAGPPATQTQTPSLPTSSSY